MATYLTDKREAFAQEYVRNGNNGSDAYRKAFPNSLKWQNNTIWARASELLKDSKVTVRIEELKKLQSDKNNTVFTYTQKNAFDELQQIQEAAFREGGSCLSTARACVDSKCKLYGLLTDKSETIHKGAIDVKTTGVLVVPAGMTPEEWRKKCEEDNEYVEEPDFNDGDK